MALGLYKQVNKSFHLSWAYQNNTSQAQNNVLINGFNTHSHYDSDNKVMLQVFF